MATYPHLLAKPTCVARQNATTKQGLLFTQVGLRISHTTLRRTEHHPSLDGNTPTNALAPFPSVFQHHTFKPTP